MKKIFAILTMAFLYNINAQDNNHKTYATYTNHNGSRNTLSGEKALYYGSEGDDNTALGFSSLAGNRNGDKNTATGSHALYWNNSGNKNTASGYMALYGENNIKDNKWSENTAIGYKALYKTIGSNNTAIGAETQTSITNAMNQTVIGYNATGQADNSVTLGNSEVTAVYMGDDSEATIYAAGLRTASNAILTLSDDDATFSDDVTVNGDLTVASDARLKANIVSLGATLAKLLLIDGKTYTLKKNGKQKIGLLAQDIQKVFPELVHKNDNEMLAVNYQGLVPVLINALKEQDVKISRLERLVEKLIADK